MQMNLAPRVFEVEAMNAAVELCETRRWTDGLPVIFFIYNHFDRARAKGLGRRK